MISLKLTDNTLINFAEKVQDRNTRAINRLLFQMGGYLRTRAYRSVRKSREKPLTARQIAQGRLRKNYIPADPGKPYRRANDKLRKQMVFNVDPRNESVEVGYRDWAKDVAERQELGGTFTVKGKTRTYPARPAVFGAFEAFKKDGAQQLRYAHLYKQFFEKGE